MITRKQIEEEMVNRCLDELYQASQPSITLEEFLEKCKNDPNKPHYNEHYLDSEACKCIIDKYIEMYRLQDKFKCHCDILIEDMTKGCSKSIYINGEGDKPGYRGYEEVAPLKEIIGEEAFNEVIKFIEMRKDFYRFNKNCESFQFTCYNYAPSSNKKNVLEYYESIGQPIEIVDLDPTYNYERYWEGWSEEEIEEDKLYNNE